MNDMNVIHKKSAEALTSSALQLLLDVTWDIALRPADAPELIGLRRRGLLIILLLHWPWKIDFRPTNAYAGCLCRVHGIVAEVICSLVQELDTVQPSA